MAGAAGAKTSSARPRKRASSDDEVSRAIFAFDPRSRGDVNEKNMPAFNLPVQKHSFAERRDRGKACLHRLRRFATECGMNIAAMKKPGGGSAGFSKRIRMSDRSRTRRARWRRQRRRRYRRLRCLVD